MCKYIKLIIFVLISVSNNLFAHPHAFIEMKAKPLVEENKLVGFSMLWTLDEMSSAPILYDMQQAKRNPQRLQQLAGEAMGNIVSEHYFSSLFDRDGKPVKYSAKPKNYGMKAEGNSVSYYFDFMLFKPRELSYQEFTLSTYDPTYYVAMYYDQEQKNKTSVDFSSLPKNCRGEILEPNVDEKIRLYASKLDQSQRNEDDSLGVIFAQKVKLICD
ncbi:zinc transporter binding subunit ZevA [[Haemophilus] felis]|nr:zinc transporter binding subunit ZevA [[Haemophilus] felis]